MNLEVPRPSDGSIYGILACSCPQLGSKKYVYRGVTFERVVLALLNDALLDLQSSWHFLMTYLMTCHDICRSLVNPEDKLKEQGQARMVVRDKFGWPVQAKEAGQELHAKAE